MITSFQRLLFNDKNSIRTQILASYSLVLILSIGITLGICYGMLFGAGSSSYQTASLSIISDTENNCLTFAREVSSAISQQLNEVGQSVCQGGVLYAATLFNTTNVKGTILAPFPTYRDYNFKAKCRPPSCPPDYGPFGTKTRIPSHTNYTNGSVTFTSTYLYSSSLKMSARNASVWNATMHKFPDAHRAELALSYQDLDMRVAYFTGSNAAIFYYLSTQIISSSGAYASVHRTFPGVGKSSEPTYNPPGRPWFQHAPINAVYLYGPYTETFTRLPVVALSSKQTVTVTLGQKGFIVSAAVIQLNTLIQIVKSIQYPDGGFGAVVRYNAPYTVLTWGNLTSSYNQVTGQFTTLAEYAPSILSHNIQLQNTFDYTDQLGVQYIVASVPFFSVTDGAVQNGVSTNSLIMLVFSRRDQATAPLVSLQTNIDITTASVTKWTLIMIAIFSILVMYTTWALVLWMTSPLTKIKRISAQLIHSTLTARDSDNVDYTGLIQDAFFAQSAQREDEIGALTKEYYRVICALHNLNVEKRQTPKYPNNPFHFIGREDFSHLTWNDILQRHWTDNASSTSCAQPLLGDVNNVHRISGVVDLDTVTFNPLINNPTSLDRSPPTFVALDRVVVGGIEMLPGATYASVPTAAIEVQAEAIPMPAAASSVPLRASLRTKLYCVGLLLLLGLLIVMIITTAELSSNGSQWMTQTSADLETSQISNINAIASVKAVFVKSYFQQMSADMITGAQVVSLMQNFNLTTVPLLSTGHYLKSYAIDPSDPYSYKFNSTTFSSYFFPSWALKRCYSVNTYACSANFNQLNETRQLSLTDLRISSYFYSESRLSSIQIGIQNSGEIRTTPYFSSSLYSQPTQCFVQDTSTSACASKYQTSACNLSSGSFSYPPYDPRCRTWYNQARQHADPTKAYFQYPRQSSGSGFVISSVAPLRQFGQIGGSLLGAIAFNFNAQSLSDNVNALRILESGYSYLIDGTNTSRLVLHPYASQYCVLVHCAEGFTAVEYQQFVTAVLAPLQANTIAQSSGSSAPQQAVAGAYYKQGQRWIIAFCVVTQGTIQYVLVVTVPDSAIKESGIVIQNKIATISNGMVSILAFFMLFFCIVLFCTFHQLVNTIVGPVEQLTTVLKLAAADDLTGQIPTEAQSLDLKVLLLAFSDLMVALRFGSDSYARGDAWRAHEAFSDALALYRATGNLRGEASAHNNLGVAELQLRRIDESRIHFEAALELGKDLLAQTKSANEQMKLTRLLSDRKGNLAVVLLEEKRTKHAYLLLEQLITSDRDQGYVMGMVVKQGILGHNYLQQGELGFAENVFTSALQFTRAGSTDGTDGLPEWSPEEACAAEQVALYNMSCLRSAQNRQADAVQLLLEALSRGRVMHTQTANKVLGSLQELFKQDGKTLLADSVAREAAACGFSSKPSGGTIKRVVFVVDYSGSMAGSKIHTAVDNLTRIAETHLYDHDNIALIHFTHKVFVDLPLIRKGGNESRVMTAIASLNRPEGTTAFYDAVYNAKITLDAGGTNQDWIVALTDGGDNSSNISLAQLTQNLRASHVHAVVLGIGGDVETAQLQQVAAATSKGLYIGAAGDKASIDSAFGRVIAHLNASADAAIQVQLVLEE